MSGPFTVGGHEYIVGRLNARQQFDIVRRLGVLNMLFEDPVLAEHREGARWIGVLLTGQLAQMPQFEMDFILNMSLGIINRIPHGGGKPVPAFNNQTGLPMFEDIDMTHMLELSAIAMEENLGPFYKSLQNTPRGTSDGEMTDQNTFE